MKRESMQQWFSRVFIRKSFQGNVNRFVPTKYLVKKCFS